MQSELVWVGSQLAGVFLIAALVNRFARAHRPRLRRVVTLFAIYVAMLGLALTIDRVDAEWSERLFIASDLFRVISIINMAGMLLFLILLPAVSIRLPMIAGDLFVGLCYIVATVVVLTRHGLNPSSVIATGAVVSAVLVISLQTTLGNILGGVALQLDGSISEDDYIQLDNGRHGRVRAVRWRHTILETADSATIIVPNALLLASNITILVPRHTQRAARTSVTFTVALTFAPARVTKLVGDALARSPIDNVALEPAPSCVCTDTTRTDGFATYAARYFVIDVARRDDTDALVRARIHTILLRAGIPLSSKDRIVTPAIEGYVETLRSVSLLQSCTDDELQALADTLTFVPYAAGEVIVRQGTPSRWLYIIRSGTVEVRARFDPDGAGPAREHMGVVATLTAPDFFGEMGLLTGEPRNADVVASTDVECLRIGRDAIDGLLAARPEVANELSERLAARRGALDAVRTDLDEASRVALSARERERIRDGIKRFFGL
jgi:CRP-like cAMP-binding protein/small-conductance mechanosensitive channel